MTDVHRAYSFALLQAASLGDAAAVRAALASGADINAADRAGRTALTCVIAGNSWQTVDATDASFMSMSRLSALKAIVSHPDISLPSLNAPQACINNVTPLGMAAWLDMPVAVQALLEYSAGTIFVDGMDSHGATPLMYAARDGNYDIVQLLLSHGARPDLRDMCHRTSIQFALSHQEVLWSCEDALRQYRRQEKQNGNRRNLSSSSQLTQHQMLSLTSASDPSFTLPIFARTSHFTEALIQSVLTSNLPVINTLLSSSRSSQFPYTPNVGLALVNAHNSAGWSAIHYCVSVLRPSIDVLDSLYLAGADVSLFTQKEHYSPLHVLARLARASDQSTDSETLYQFVIHLVRDLRAPLSAKDDNEETCIHMAAEYGSCTDVLQAFLDCDTTGHVRNIRNSRGLTALEVSQPHLRAVFGDTGEEYRPQSSLSVRTIRPSISLSSLSSFTARAPASSSALLRSRKLDNLSSSFSPSIGIDVSTSSQELLDNLQWASAQLKGRGRTVEPECIQELLKDTAHLGKGVIVHFREQTGEAAKELRGVREVLSKIDELWNIVSCDVEDQVKYHQPDLDAHGWELFTRQRRANRESNDSQVTAVEVDEGSLCFDDKLKSLLGAIEESSEEPTRTYKDVAVMTDPLHAGGIETKDQVTGARTVPWPEWLDDFILRADSATYKRHLANLVEIEQELAVQERKINPEKETRVSPAKDSVLVGLLKGRRKENGSEKDGWASTRATENAERSGTSRLKAWLKKKVAPERPLKFEIVLDLDDQCAVAREVKGSPSSEPFAWNSEVMAGLVDGGGYSFQKVLAATSRDLSNIEEALQNVDYFISTASHSISRAERLIKNAIMIRETASQCIQENPAYTDNISSSNPDDSFDSSYLPNLLEYYGYPSSTPTTPTTPTTPASTTSFSTPTSSAGSSIISLASTLIDDEDEDVRALRRLLLRKINARVEGAFDEIDRVNIWLRTVRDILQHLRKRTRDPLDSGAHILLL